jgi:hypothetical protein
MVAVILITSLIIIILIILLSLAFRLNSTPEKLKAHSIVIVDTRGQQTVSEVEFSRFMDKIGAILVNNRHFDFDGSLPMSKFEVKVNGRDKFQNKYINPAAEELKAWIRSTDNYPYALPAKFTNPIDDEINAMGGESNPIMIYKNQKKSITSSDTLVSLEDVAEYVRQIKEINLQFPENERKSINMIKTHKLIIEILKQYYDSVDPNIFDRPLAEIIDAPTNTKLQTSHESKMKIHKKENEPLLDSSLSQRNSLVDVSGFADDDKTGTSNSRTHDNMDLDKANSAIEGMIVRRAPARAKYTGGRRFIRIEN